MKRITERDKIREVAERWVEQYSSDYWKNDKRMQGIGAELKALNPETATADEVAHIVGNWSWTDIRCDECQQRVKAAVMIAESESEPDTFLCKECLEQAVSLFG